MINQRRSRQKFQNAGEPDLTLSDLLRKLTVPQIWGLAVALVALVGGSVGVGAWVQSARDDDKIMEKNLEIANSSSKYDQLKVETDNKTNQLNTKLLEAERNFNGATDEINEIGRARLALETKSEFLERFLSYRNAPYDNIPRKLFEDYVCALWKHAEERRVQVESRPVNISPDQIRGGLSPELKQLLISRGVPEIYFEHAMRGETLVSPSSGEAIATIQQQAQALSLVKIVHFFDGTIYQVPEEIALAVHTNPACAPQ